MCEALVCVKDLGKTGELSWDSHQPQQGDVVIIKPDGWNWSAAELGQVDHPNYPKHSFFRVIKFPNVTLSQASKMTTPEQDVDPANPSPYLQFRAFFFDKTKLPAGAFTTYWNDDARAQGFITLTQTASQMNNFVSQRTPVPF